MDSPSSLASEIRSMSFDDIFLLTTMAVVAVSFVGSESYLGIDDWTIAWGLTLLGMAWAFSRRRVAYSPMTFGTKHRTDTYPIETGEQIRCDCCGKPAENGRRRRYAKQQVAFGIPLRTLDWGENAYCRDCLSPESDTEFDSEEKTTDGNDHALELEGNGR
ncbi:hypothetical protein [Haladaptatus sp. DYF46]|uniref:hypothetical protein n=1 Tax=Haladaptatus sp. DYF46 TaxID=2886041 RepID=UPI001E3C2E0B|nr:hypothetical protein [Haladaptatus sp. DYF46]